MTQINKVLDIGNSIEVLDDASIRRIAYFSEYFGALAFFQTQILEYLSPKILIEKIANKNINDAFNYQQIGYKITTVSEKVLINIAGSDIRLNNYKTNKRLLL